MIIYDNLLWFIAVQVRTMNEATAMAIQYIKPTKEAVDIDGLPEEQRVKLQKQIDNKINNLFLVRSTPMHWHLL